MCMYLANIIGLSHTLQQPSYFLKTILYSISNVARLAKQNQGCVIHYPGNLSLDAALYPLFTSISCNSYTYDSLTLRSWMLDTNPNHCIFCLIGRFPCHSCAWNCCSSWRSHPPKPASRSFHRDTAILCLKVYATDILPHLWIPNSVRITIISLFD